MRLLIVATILVSFACKGTPPANESSETQATHETIVLDVSIEGMTCTGCESTIESTVASINGISSVDAMHASGKAMIEASIVNLDTIMIKNKIEAAGYSVISIDIIK